MVTCHSARRQRAIPSYTEGKLFPRAEELQERPEGGQLPLTPMLHLLLKLHSLLRALAPWLDLPFLMFCLHVFAGSYNRPPTHRSNVGRRFHFMDNRAVELR